MSNLTYSQAVKRLRRIHAGILQRCLNPKHPSYHYYGGRGIGIDPSLKDWPDFVKYAMTLEGFDDPTLSTDRIDNSKGYAPGNIRFATPLTQVHNRRAPVNKRTPDLAAVSKAGFTMLGDFINEGGDTIYKCKCNACGFVSGKQGSKLQPDTILSCGNCGTADGTIKFSNMLASLGDLQVGFESGNWVVIDPTPIKNRLGTHSVMCGCSGCGASKLQPRGLLLLGRPKHCLTCFNRKQQLDALARKAQRTATYVGTG